MCGQCICLSGENGSYGMCGQRELRGLMGRSHIINGFDIQEIEFLLDFICNQY